jgi:hypothetical protein
MGVLIDGMVAAIESSGTDVQALLVGDFFGADELRCVTRARGSDGGIEWVGKGIAQRYARRSGFNELPSAGAFEHAGLIGHDGRLFYTDGESEPTRTQSKGPDKFRINDF